MAGLIHALKENDETKIKQFQQGLRWVIAKDESIDITELERLNAEGFVAVDVIGSSHLHTKNGLVSWGTTFFNWCFGVDNFINSVFCDYRKFRNPSRLGTFWKVDFDCSQFLCRLLFDPWQSILGKILDILGPSSMEGLCKQYGQLRKFGWNESWS